MEVKKESEGLKAALATLIGDLREDLKDLGIKPEGNSLFPAADLNDLQESHQPFIDPQHCDAINVNPNIRAQFEASKKKISWVDANQSDYPVKVAKAYWNSTQAFYGVLNSLPTSWSSTANEFKTNFVNALQKMNANFEFIDDEKLGDPKLRTQAPRVVDPRTLRLAKTYKKFVETMMQDSDPLRDIRDQVAKFALGNTETAANAINSYKEFFQGQFAQTQRILEERIGTYEARLNDNILVEGSDEPTMRIEKLKDTPKKRVKESQEFIESAARVEAELQNFTESDAYQHIESTQKKIEALEGQLKILGDLVNFDVQKNILALMQEKDELASLYVTMDPNYMLSIFAGEPVSDVINPLNQEAKTDLRAAYEHAIQTLENSRNTVEQRRDALQIIKQKLLTELELQRAILRKEAAPRRPSLAFAQRDIATRDVETLRENRKIWETVISESNILFGSTATRKSVDKLREGTEYLIESKEKRELLETKVERLSVAKSELVDVQTELKTAKLPIDEALFAKLKTTLQWSEADEMKWRTLREAPGWGGMLSVAVRWSTDPIVQVTQTVSESLASIKVQEEQLTAEIQSSRERETQFYGEFNAAVTDAEKDFEQTIHHYTQELVKYPDDLEALAATVEARKALEEVGEQLFGKNETHQRLFQQFDQQYEALAKPKAETKEVQQPEDSNPAMRGELYKKYFGEKAIVEAYLEKRESKTLYKVRDTLQKKLKKGASEIDVRIDYFAEISKVLEQYEKNGDLELLMKLQGQLQMDVTENKFPARVDSLIKAKKSTSQLSPDSMNAVLLDLEKDIRVELGRRFKESPSSAPAVGKK